MTYKITPAHGRVAPFLADEATRLRDSLALQVSNLSCLRGERLLFDHLNFELPFGEVLHVLGANGSGKSSLLRVLAGLIPSEAGEVQLDASILIYMGHLRGLNGQLTVLENLSFYQQLSGRRGNLQSALEYFDLGDLASCRVGQLSAGQAQKVALTRLLLSAGRLWLLDEPFTALDQSSCQRLLELLTSHCQQGGAVVLTSHQALSSMPVTVRCLSLDEKLHHVA